MSERKIESGPGFFRAKECPDCGHTRCGEDCVCNCDAARAEYDAAQKDAVIKALADALDLVRGCVPLGEMSEAAKTAYWHALRLAGRL